MPKSFIVFNGQSSTKFGLTIEELPDSNHPERRAAPYQIEGRNGSFVHEDGVFGNYEQGYAFNTRNITTGRNTYQTARDIASWLLSSSGYCRLEDTYEPEYYRLARFAGPFNVENILRRYGRGTLSFDCRPERYLKSGEKAITLFENVDLSTSIIQHAFIMNPCAFSAKPLIRLTGRGQIRLMTESCDDINADITDLLIQLNHQVDMTITIDCASFEVSEPSWVTYKTLYPILPTLQPGRNQLSVTNVGTDKTGYITKLEIIPRWWTV